MNLQKEIQDILEKVYKPIYLSVKNESSSHRVSKGSETHFQIHLVSENFKELSLLQRHRHVYSTLENQMKKGIWALSLGIWTPEEWASQTASPASPPCVRGKKK